MLHNLRKTFLAQNGVLTAVIQRLLDHSLPDLTNKMYKNVDPFLRHAIDTMPVEDWLRIRIVGKKRDRSKKMKKYECTVCGYIYDPEAGDPENNIKPMTAFEDLPKDWACPECGAGKEEFELVKE